MKPLPAVPAAIGAALGVAAASLAGLISLNTGAALVAQPLVLGLTPGVDEAAFRALSPPEDLVRAETKARQALALSPYQNNARLRLAYIQYRRDGRLNAAGAAEFARTYELVPVDAEVAAWRLRFGLEHWQDITPASRMAVEREARAFIAAGSNDVSARRILEAVRNPSGRLAAALWLHSIDTAQR
jgi:hypothetical protein